MASDCAVCKLVPWHLPHTKLGFPCNKPPGWELLILTPLGRCGRKVYPPRRPTPLIVHRGTVWTSPEGFRLMRCGGWIPDGGYPPTMFEEVTCEGCIANRDAMVSNTLAPVFFAKGDNGQ